MIHRSAFLLAALALVCVSMGDPVKRVYQPSISPDGQTIAFSWQGDIWKMPRAGGRAERLTVHPANDAYPVWFPDGKRIAFSTTRFGGANVATMTADGSDLKRVTFESSASLPTAVSPDGKTIYGQSTAFTALRPNLFKVPATGGDLIRLTEHPFEGSFTPSLSPDGKRVIFGRGSYGTQSWQKIGVKSAAMANIFVGDNTTPVSHQAPIDRTESTQLFPHMASDGSIYYVSNDNGWPNIWRMSPDGKSKKRLTDHKDGGISWMSCDRDGRFAAYVFESTLFALDTVTGKYSEVAVDVPGDARTNPVQEITFNSNPEEFAVSPDSKRIVLASRGDLFVLPEKGGTTRRITSNPAWDGHPAFLDAKTLVYSTSVKGKRVLKTQGTDGTSKVLLEDAADLFRPIPSPDGKMVAFFRGTDEVAIAPVAGGPIQTISRGAFGNGVFDSAPYAWSPDNKWLMVDVQTPLGSSQLTLFKVGTNQKIVIGLTAHGASNPQFLPNGRGVTFTAAEYGGNPDLFVIDLVPNELTFTEDDLDKIDEKPAKKAGEVTVEVQEEGILRRMRRLTTSGEVEQFAASADSKSIYVVQGGALQSIPVAGGAAKPLEGAPAGIGGLTLGPGGSKLYFVVGGKLSSYGLERPGVAPIAFSCAYQLNLRDEEKALFEEIHWAMDRFYYNPAMNGKNWPTIREKFSKIVPFCTDRNDFYALMGEMMEELESSHLGSTPPPTAPDASLDSVGYIGAEFVPSTLESRGVYIVSRVVPGSPADHPTSKLKVGDRILAVDGVEPDANHPFASLLNKKSGKKVALKVERDSLTKEITIKPSSSAAQRELEYEGWVEWERKETERLSDGKLTYVHIRGMDDASFLRFLREIRTYAVGKKGVLVDVRYNGGGSTSHKVLGVMIKTNWLVRTTRGYAGLKLSENIYRGDSLELPSGLLMNTYSYSNAEIMGEGFRRLIKGPIVGERTPGYVIGTGGYTLWDAGFIRMPQIGCYDLDGGNLENNGRRPDHVVWFDPSAWSAGRDPQLEKAVTELLKTIR